MSKQLMLEKGVEYQIKFSFTKFDLMVALFEGDSNGQKRLKIRNDTPKTISLDCDIHILGITREDGSGNRWIISGDLEFGGAYDSTTVSAYVDIKTQSGTMRLEE